MSESFAELFEQSLKTSKIAPGGLIVKPASALLVWAAGVGCVMMNMEGR